MIKPFVVVNINIFIWILSYMYPIIALIALFFGNWNILISYIVVAITSRFAFPILYSHDIQNKIVEKNFKEYFNAQYIDKPTDIPKNKVLFAHFPHGLFCGGFNINGGQGTKYIKCIARELINIPIFGDLLKYLKYTSCDKHNMHKLMKKSENIMLLPGGFHEVFMMTNYEYNLYVPKGFIVLCLKHEYTIYPCLTLGENETYNTITVPKKLWVNIRNILKYFKFPFILAFGRWMTFFAKNTPLTTIYGNPICCIDNKDGTDQIDRIHKEVIQSLKNSFDNNIVKYCKSNSFDQSKYSIVIHT